MCDQEFYLPLRIQPAGDCHCHRTCKSLYSIEALDGDVGSRLYFCTFCDHARVEESPDGDLMRLDYCRQYTTAGAELPFKMRIL